MSTTPVQKATDARSFWVIVLSTVGSLVMANILLLDHFVRVDLTHDQNYTLSQATLDTLADIEDPVTVTAYFTKDLPPQFASNARHVADLLEEYRERSNGMVSFEFIDPADLETDEDKETKKNVKRGFLGQLTRQQTSVEKELQALGIQPVQMRVIDDDEQVNKNGYMGIAIRYQEEARSVPVVQSVEGLEYQLTSQIKVLTQARQPVLGITQGHGEPSLTESRFLSSLKDALSQTYDVRGVDFANLKGDELKGALDDIDALLVAGPQMPFNEEHAKALDAFIASGKSAAFAIDAVSMDLQTFQPTPVDTGLDVLFDAWGITVSGDLVADIESAALSIPDPRSLLGARQIKYFFLPAPKGVDPEHPVTRGLNQLMLPFASAVYVTPKDGTEGKVLVKSSDESWLQKPDPQSVNPRKRWTEQEVTFNGPHDMAVAVSGKLPSAFSVERTGDKTSKVVVVGTSAMLKDDFAAGGSGQLTGALLFNITEWMLMDQGFLEMRTRGMRAAPIAKDLDDGTRQAVKILNVVGVPGAVLVLWFVVWQMRGQRRRRYAAQFAEHARAKSAGH